VSRDEASERAPFPRVEEPVYATEGQRRPRQETYVPRHRKHDERRSGLSEDINEHQGQSYPHPPVTGHHDYHHSVAYHEEFSEPMRYTLSNSGHGPPPPETRQHEG
jgi:hypothetical protein